MRPWVEGTFEAAVGSVVKQDISSSSRRATEEDVQVLFLLAGRLAPAPGGEEGQPCHALGTWPLWVLREAGAGVWGVWWLPSDKTLSLSSRIRANDRGQRGSPKPSPFHPRRRPPTPSYCVPDAGPRSSSSRMLPACGIAETVAVAVSSQRVRCSVSPSLPCPNALLSASDMRASPPPTIHHSSSLRTVSGPHTRGHYQRLFVRAICHVGFYAQSVSRTIQPRRNARG